MVMAEAEAGHHALSDEPRPSSAPMEALEEKMPGE